MRLPRLTIAATVLIALPAYAQTTRHDERKPSAKPTKVIAKSDQLVTARAPNGDTRSFNCRKPANAKREVCRR